MHFAVNWYEKINMVSTLPLIRLKGVCLLKKNLCDLTKKLARNDVSQPLDIKE